MGIRGCVIDGVVLFCAEDIISATRKSINCIRKDPPGTVTAEGILETILASHERTVSKLLEEASE